MLQCLLACFLECQQARALLPKARKPALGLLVALPPAWPEPPPSLAAKPSPRASGLASWEHRSFRANGKKLSAGLAQGCALLAGKAASAWAEQRGWAELASSAGLQVLSWATGLRAAGCISGLGAVGAAERKKERKKG